MIECSLGKSTLLSTYTLDAFPGEYDVPMAIDYYSAKLVVEEKCVCLNLIDTTGMEAEGYDKMRTSSYSQAVRFEFTNLSGFK